MSSTSRGAATAVLCGVVFDATGSPSSQSRLRSANLSGKSVRSSAKTSPLRPCGWRIRARWTQSSGTGVSDGRAGPDPEAAAISGLVFFQDVERIAVMQLHADGAQDGAH